MKEFTFSVPQNIIVGKGSLAKLPEVAEKLGGKHGFIISGPHLNKMGIVGSCADALKAKGIESSVFTETEGNPSVETVDKAAEAYKAQGKRRRLHRCTGRRFADGCGKSGRRCCKIRRKHHGV